MGKVWYNSLRIDSRSPQMKQVNLPLDYIIKMANNNEFPDDDVQIARALVHHLHSLPEMNIDGFVFVSSLSKSALIKFYTRLGYLSFAEFVIDIFIGVNARKRQMVQRYGNYDVAATISRFENFTNLRFEYMDVVDEICAKIFQSGRVVCFGAIGQTTLLQDFQQDLLLMKKEVLVDSIIEGHDAHLLDDDLVFLFSASGRIFYLAPTQFKLDVLASANDKVLFCQKPVIAPTDTLLLATNAPDDYFTHRFVFQHLIDLIRVRYYELYYLVENTRDLSHGDESTFL